MLGVLRQIGPQEGGRPVAAVALSWIVGKGGLPLVGTRKVEQAREAIDALGWRLTDRGECRDRQGQLPRREDCLVAAG